MNWPSDRPSGSPALAAVLVWTTLTVSGVAGCRGCGDAEPPTPPSVDIRVDGPKIDYVYRARDGRLRTAASVTDIPSTLRGAVMVHHPTMTGARQHADRVYVANLLGAEPDDTVEAQAFTREAYAERTARLREARQMAELVRIAALDLTQLHPGSDRRAAADEARETFDEILPRLRSPDATSATGDTGTDSSSQPDVTADTRSSRQQAVP